MKSTFKALADIISTENKIVCIAVVVSKAVVKLFQFQSDIDVEVHFCDTINAFLDVLENLAFHEPTEEDLFVNILSPTIYIAHPRFIK